MWIVVYGTYKVCVRETGRTTLTLHLATSDKVQTSPLATTNCTPWPQANWMCIEKEGTPPKCLAPVVETLDSTIHRINHYPADKYYAIRWIAIYLVDSAIQRWNNAGLDFGKFSRQILINFVGINLPFCWFPFFLLAFAHTILVSKNMYSDCKISITVLLLYFL